VRALCRRAAGDERLELAGLMTHFATADEPGDDHFPAQLARFSPLAAELAAEHPGLIVHAANSAATFRDRAVHFDLVRCGIAAYGLDPFGEDPAARALEPALSLESYVAAVKRFEPGTSAGYGRSWRAAEATWVGVLPIGYGDGVRRALSNNGRVLVRGRPRPLVGTVSMDNVTVDLGPETDVEPGDRAVLIGSQGDERILCEEVARRLDTINYEVTCGLTPRVRRAYLGP
jgi:alanine racemase